MPANPGRGITAKEAWARMLEASQAWLESKSLEAAEAMEKARQDFIDALEVWNRR
jgi:hypothetical protein